MAIEALVYWEEDPVTNDEEWLSILGAQLAELRDEKDLTQDQVAAKLGVSRRTIVKYESGEGKRLPFFLQYLEVLDSDLAMLALRSRGIIKARRVDLDALDAETMRIVNPSGEDE